MVKAIVLPSCVVMAIGRQLAVFKCSECLLYADRHSRTHIDGKRPVRRDHDAMWRFLHASDPAKKKKTMLVEMGAREIGRLEDFF